MKLIDCHCHLSDDHFTDAVLAKNISEATNASVRINIGVSENIETAEKLLRVVKDHDSRVRICLGLHPVQADRNEDPEAEFDTIERSATVEEVDEMIKFIKDHANSLGERLVGIGEAGLDFQPRIAGTTDKKDQQREVLRKQATLAKELGLPLNLHSRSAGGPTIQLLIEEGFNQPDAPRVLLHAFDGGKKAVKQGVAAGFYFSIPPSVLREGRSVDNHSVLAHCPIEQLCLETDAPALGPEPGLPNELKNLRHFSLKAVSLRHKIPEEDVAEILLENTLTVFPRLRSAL
eukprot:Clim_evm17s165 gene=Clim_evmTU17s165